MKKRIVSFVVALLLVLSLSPAALAAPAPGAGAVDRASALIAEGMQRLADIQELPGPFVKTAGELGEFIFHRAAERDEDGYFFYVTAPELLSQDRDALRTDLGLLLYCYAIGVDYQLEQLSDQLLRVEVVQELRPGLRMLDAWRAGDWSALSDREQEALSVAQAEVDAILAEHTGLLQIERAIHDYICRSFTYTDYDPEAEYSCLNAADALISGRANCQGYADAFFLMAGMAGFQVKNLCGWSLTEADVTHIFNLIELDRSWYVVDCTGDDTDDGGLINYVCFNAGWELYSETLGWKDYYEPVPIQETDQHFFFNSDSFAHGCSSSLDELAAYALELLYGQGQEWSYMVLEGWNDESGLAAAFNSAMLNQSRPDTAWSYYYSVLGGDTYISMRTYYT